MVTGHLASLEARLVALTEEVPALYLASETSLEQRVSARVELLRSFVEQAANAAERNAIDKARAHAEAAAGAAETTAAAAAAAAAAETTAAAAAAEALNQQWTDRLMAEIASVRREITVARRVDQSLQSTAEAPSAERSAAPSAPIPPIDPGLYVALEDRFRGDPEVIAERQTVYLPLIEDLADQDHPVLDLGCGRGEWIKLLSAKGIPAIGVDSNPAFVGEVGDSEATVVQGDLVAYLHSARESSAGAITMFQVVEHLPFPVLVDVISECARVLRPGGLLIAETPNALNLSVAASTFWLDPTHERPLHPELLKFIAKQVGFAKIDGWFLNELHPRPNPDGSAAIDRLLEMIDGPGDFSLLAWV